MVNNTRKDKVNLSKTLFVLLFLISSINVFGETTTDTVFSKLEFELSSKALELSKVRFNDKLADSLSNALSAEFEKVLLMDGALSYPFDSLKGIGKVESNDKNMRIFTWNSVRNDGTYKYYGFIHVHIKEKKITKVFQLTDKSDSIPDVEKASLAPDTWYGALYYDIVETKLNEGILYTLFGWDGNDLYTNKKVIESLTFSTSGKPKFGKSVFRVGKSKQKRIIFEYSRMANMMIAYDDELDMIVYDHLSPSSPTYQNNPAYYGPDFSYDGFKFENNVWNHKSEVDYKSTPESNTRNKKKRKK